MNNYESNFNKALEMYKNGISLTQIGKELGVNRKRLSKDFKKLGITITQNGQKYSYNYNIFEQIDTEHKAYWLGFLYADGYNSTDHNCVELALAEYDYEHLVKFRRFIGDESIKIQYKSSTNAYKIAINSKKISHDLYNLGCVQAKSLILQFPTEEQVPNHLIHHFMRGYFDGDGSIIAYNSKMYPRFSVLGTPEFLSIYEDYILKKLNRNNRNKRGRSHNWSDRTEEIHYSGIEQVQKIYNFLYKDATIYLDRKFDKFNILLPSQNETDINSEIISAELNEEPVKPKMAGNSSPKVNSDISQAQRIDSDPLSDE